MFHLRNQRRTSNTLAATVQISTAEPLRVDVIAPAPLLLTAILNSHVLGLPQTYFHNTHTHTYTQVQLPTFQARGSLDQTSSTVYASGHLAVLARILHCPRELKEHRDLLTV